MGGREEKRERYRKEGEGAGKMKEGRREKNQTTSNLINLMQNEENKTFCVLCRNDPLR